jgi:hypothetical protein
MNRTERRQFRPECRFEKLELRELLNAHLPRPQAATIAQTFIRLSRPITGTLNGVSSYVGGFTGTDSYSFSGRTSAGQAGVGGTDSYSSTLKNPSTYSNYYFAGDWTMTLNSGSTVKIVYTGSGPSNVTTGKFVDRLKGTAIGISGALTGKTYSFIGKAWGPGTTPATTLTFRLS